MTKDFWKATGIRALRSFFQAIVSQIPASFVITPAMIQYFNIGYVYVIIAIIANAILYAFASVVTSVVTGLPEVEYAQHIYMSEDEPEDSYYDEEEYDGEE